MKFRKLTAAIMAAATTIMPLSLNSSVFLSPASVSAVDQPSLQDWVPSDFESALEFRNTYGATHIESGLICIVLENANSYNEQSDELRYRLMTTENVMETCSHDVYRSDETGVIFEVYVYKPTTSGDIDIAVIDTWAKSTSLDLGYSHASAYYTFNADNDLNVTETDIYSWLPDCVTEYKSYIDDNGYLSVRNNYVVFCLTHSAGTPYQWYEDSNGGDTFELDEISNCCSVDTFATAGGAINTVYAYKAVNDGCAKISYNYGKMFGDMEVMETRTADCAVFNDAQTILLDGQMRATLVDYDTGEPIEFGTDTHPSISTNISISTPEGEASTGPVLVMESNPSIVDNNIGRFFDADSFSFSLNENGLPEGYVFPDNSDQMGYYNGKITPEGSIKVSRFDNGSADVVFRLKSSPTGDVNGDGEFNIADVVLLQKWLIKSPEAQLVNWKAADFCKDNKLDVFDLCIMKQKLIETYKNYVEPEVRTEYPSTLFIIRPIKMYTGPDTSYPVLLTIPETRVKELGYMKDNNDWVFTDFEGRCGWIQVRGDDGEMNMFWGELADKPVIYLYPEQETDVHVELELTEADLSTTYPKYNNGWDVVAYPDGTLLNKADGSHHRYLFWDAVNVRTHFDLSKGFCVAGCDTESFLKEKLTYMGLTEDEMNEFIVYWLPLMEHNAYNLISFQGDAYTNSAKLNITPAPDSECRIFMAYVPLEDAVEIEPQELPTFERKGFSVVEWGGTKINVQ